MVQKKDRSLSLLIKEIQQFDGKEYHSHNDWDRILQETTQKLIAIGEPAIPQLLELLKKEKYPSFAHGAKALGEIGDERAIQLLVDYLENIDLGKDSQKALIKIGPASLPKVMDSIAYRIQNPKEESGGVSLTNNALSVVGEIRCDESVNFLNQLLTDYMEVIPKEVFDPGKRDWPYRNVDFFHLIDCMVRQQDKRCIPCLEKTRDMFPKRNTEFLICQIAIGRIKKGRLEGYLPLEYLDIAFPIHQLFAGLLGNEGSREDNFFKEYGEYFEGMEDTWSLYPDDDEYDDEDYEDDEYDWYDDEEDEYEDDEDEEDEYEDDEDEEDEEDDDKEDGR